ncbi:hypothetical protein PGT21_021321 [Puccinia graminis f. sp. tritici]|uniref:Uncharacterized protein n=1 Tax=Puccinia graminis f. sp. tritici TaxID=56615 RepID=A0A5B0QWN8_PUCGR|nr:hypothetical protein PGT21_021321 [Puccinia graminis f. sp. tritici]
MYLWNSAGFCSGTHQIHDLILPLNKWNPERAPCCSGKGHARPPSHLGPSPARWCRLHIQSELDQRAETSADNFDLARCLNPRAHHKRLYGATIATTILVIQESALCAANSHRGVGSLRAESAAVVPKNCKGSPKTTVCGSEGGVRLTTSRRKSRVVPADLAGDFRTQSHPEGWRREEDAKSSPVQEAFLPLSKQDTPGGVGATARPQTTSWLARSLAVPPF